jgi:hypothetical protein
LTRERSTFTRRELVQEFAAAHGRGGSVGRIWEFADRLIASDQIVAVDGLASVAARLRGHSTGDRPDTLFTTADMLSLEVARHRGRPSTRRDRQDHRTSRPTWMPHCERTPTRN